MMVVSYTSDNETFQAANPRLWAQKEDLEWVFDLAPNEKRFVVVQATDTLRPVSPNWPREQQDPSEVAIMLNLFDRLRRLASANRN
jgi:hypothetical protein